MELIHSKGPATRIAGGVVAGTFGTAQRIELDSDAVRIIGAQIVGVDATYTTLEGSATIMRINSSSLGLANQDFITGPIIASGPGTNSSGQPNRAELIPLDIPAKGNDKLDISFAPAGPSTVAKLYEVGLLYADSNSAPVDWKQKFPNPLAFGGGQVSRATIGATTRTNIGDVTVPGWAKEIIAMKAVLVKSGALTTLEETIGFVDIATTIKGTDPQEWPCVTAFGAPLGTPVGTGQFLGMVPYTPMFIPLPGKDQTISPFINLRTGLTAAAQVAFAIAYR